MEQYRRKDCLILSGEGVPVEGEGETPPQTREIAHAIIKDTLKVDLQGGITACHRLKNRNRVLVKFSDHDDKNAIYQAKFSQRSVVVHESLTKNRSLLLVKLNAMRDQGKVANYHTRNGKVMARDAPNKRYVAIHPSLNENEICHTMSKAQTFAPRNNNGAHGNSLVPKKAKKAGGSGNSGSRVFINQNHEQLPADQVLNRPSDLEDHIVNKSNRVTRQTKERLRSEGHESPTESGEQN